MKKPGEFRETPGCEKLWTILSEAAEMRNVQRLERKLVENSILEAPGVHVSGS